jgi:hypothetical protein
MRGWACFLSFAVLRIPLNISLTLLLFAKVVVGRSLEVA